MTTTTDVAQVFADAREMYLAALSRLSEGDIRDASEKAWCAAKRATDALVLARSGELPERSTDTGSSLRRIAKFELAARIKARTLTTRHFDVSLYIVFVITEDTEISSTNRYIGRRSLPGALIPLVIPPNVSRSTSISSLIQLEYEQSCFAGYSSLSSRRVVGKIVRA